ncbi:MULTISPECIES: dihydroxyacetone kinase subunit DhaL [unclassified Methylophaga]|uniref:dihydroxyacetone kinase subunit DhaL n=1 Tax=unclassified Methylophaga TaxID=2629249 RepID=UPI000C8DE3D4|nr:MULTISPECIES: dihydroxyacetone kinase subunit DhaL [unclassified Methylophaga]MBN46857.1 dihydroxyacetone kinase subunit L [Methylophaga sp.]|tara:strand:+ start:171779 stop:172411 length:633 start_codon:yes stop_codon:yes gene_type:complete
MSDSSITVLPFIQAIKDTINNHADEIAHLDQAIGDGDHLINLQRGVDALLNNSDALKQLDFSAALSKIGMTLMSTMGGASGSLFGSMFVTMGKTAKDKQIDSQTVSDIFTAGVESIKARGKAGMGEKTMLDTLIPASSSLQQSISNGVELSVALEDMKKAAIDGMESTKDMLATKGRASFLGERARGHIDAGARTSQLMLCAIADCIIEK